jgi:hypothetical protein
MVRSSDGGWSDFGVVGRSKGKKVGWLGGWMV